MATLLIVLQAKKMRKEEIVGQSFELIMMIMGWGMKVSLTLKGRVGTYMQECL